MDYGKGHEREDMGADPWTSHDRSAQFAPAGVYLCTGSAGRLIRAGGRRCVGAMALRQTVMKRRRIKGDCGAVAQREKRSTWVRDVHASRHAQGGCFVATRHVRPCGLITAEFAFFFDGNKCITVSAAHLHAVMSDG